MRIRMPLLSLFTLLLASLGAIGPAANASACPYTTQVLDGPYTGPLADVVSARRRAVVLLKEPYSGPNHCSGVLIAPDLVITAAHCWDSVDTVGSVVFDHERQGGTVTSGREYQVVAGVETGQPSHSPEYAILRIAGNPVADLGVTPAPVRASMPLPGESVVLLGHPQNTPDWPKAVGTGAVTKVSVLVSANESTDRALRFAIHASAGSSGGGIFDSAGNLIGINAFLPGSTGLPSWDRLCELGNGAAMTADIAFYSPKVRELSNGFVLRAGGSRTGDARIYAYCYANGKSCHRWGNGTSASFEPLRDGGCALDCPVNSWIWAYCDIGAPSQPWRVMNDINWTRAVPNPTPIHSGGFRYTSWIPTNEAGANGWNYMQCWDPVSCSRQIWITGPTTVECRFDER